MVLQTPVESENDGTNMRDPDRNTEGVEREEHYSPSKNDFAFEDFKFKDEKETDSDFFEDANSSRSDEEDEYFSDSTGTPSRDLSIYKRDSESFKDGLVSSASSASLNTRSARDQESAEMSQDLFVSVTSPMQKHYGLHTSASAAAFQRPNEYYSEESPARPLRASYSSASLRRRLKQNIDIPLLPPKTKTKQPQSKMKGEVNEPTPEDEAFFRQLEIEWREQDKELNTEGSWLSTVAWFPILFGLKIVNVVYYFCFTPISAFVKIMTGVNITWAPLWNVSLEQKKQAAAVFVFVMLLPSVVIAYFVTLILLLGIVTTIPTALYLLYIFRLDKTPINGSRRPFMRYWKLWRHFVNYFPCRLIKTHNLDPNHKYVFCYHPHGIVGMGAFGNFATDATGFRRKFPGIDLRVLTLQMNFYVPFLREFLLHMGICSCAKRGCDRMLDRGKGSAILLVVGGAEESLHVAPGTYRLTLGGRKGFVRVALDNGASLVPVLGFGENDAYNTYICPEGSWSRWVQDKFKKIFGFATPIFYTNGLSFWMPHRTPIIAVVGKPIPVPEVPAHLRGVKLCTTEEGRQIVDRYHAMYIGALKDLYDTYKNRWALNRHESLLLVRHT